MIPNSLTQCCNINPRIVYTILWVTIDEKIINNLNSLECSLNVDKLLNYGHNCLIVFLMGFNGYVSPHNEISIKYNKILSKLKCSGSITKKSLESYIYDCIYSNYQQM